MIVIIITLSLLLHSNQGWELRYSSIIPLEPAYVRSSPLPSLQLLAFLQGLFTFYHHGYELAKDFNDFKTQLTISIQNVSGRGDGLPSLVKGRKKQNMGLVA